MLNVASSEQHLDIRTSLEAQSELQPFDVATYCIHEVMELALLSGVYWWVLHFGCVCLYSICAYVQQCSQIDLIYLLQVALGVCAWFLLLLSLFLTLCVCVWCLYALLSLSDGRKAKRPELTQMHFPSAGNSCR